MILILVVVAGIALTVIGLMPGDTYERGLPLAVVLVGFALLLLVIFFRFLRERYVNAKQPDWEGYEWKSPQARRQDLRWRISARARSRSGSRVLGMGSGLGSGKPNVRKSSARRQDELRVAQGRRDAAQSQSRDTLQRRRSISVEEREPIDSERETILERRSGREARNRQLSRAAERRQEELRIEQGRQYAREADFSAKGGSESVSERKKRARQRRRRDKFWRQNRSFWR